MRRPKAPVPKDWLVYMVRCSNGALYTGITNDLPKRVKAHNTGKGAMYTKFFAPVRVVFREPQADRSASLRREYAIKQLTRKGKMALIKGYNRSRKAGRRAL